MRFVTCEVLSVDLIIDIQLFLLVLNVLVLQGLNLAQGRLLLARCVIHCRISSRVQCVFFHLKLFKVQTVLLPSFLRALLVAIDQIREGLDLSSDRWGESNQCRLRIVHLVLFILLLEVRS